MLDFYSYYNLNKKNRFSHFVESILPTIMSFPTSLNPSFKVQTRMNFVESILQTKMNFSSLLNPSSKLEQLGGWGVYKQQSYIFLNELQVYGRSLRP